MAIWRLQGQITTNSHPSPPHENVGSSEFALSLVKPEHKVTEICWQEGFVVDFQIHAVHVGQGLGNNVVLKHYLSNCTSLNELEQEQLKLLQGENAVLKTYGNMSLARAAIWK